MDKKTLWIGFALLILVGGATLFVLFFNKPANFRGAAYGEPYPPAPDFQLTNASGGNFQLSDLRGKIVLLFFGYTSCPDVCPTTLAELNQALEALAAKSGSVQVVFVSVDPERDTPQIIQAYVEQFNPTFIGLSGPQVKMEQIWKDYGVFRESVPSTSAMGYTVNHTARTTLIDKDGNLRLSYGFETPVEDIVHDLEILLK